MNKELNIQQLVSYLTGNCSKEEQGLVEQWLALSNDNMMLFDEYKQVWDSTSVINDSCLINVDKSWEDFKDRANFDETVSVETTGDRKPFNVKGIVYHVARVAALVAIVFGLYLLFDKESKIETQSYTAGIVPPDSPFVLPDGSGIIMNEGAKIDYPEHFNSNIRYVDFEGEAFFDIAHNPEKPMVVATGNVRVKVLGTSFNLCNCIDTDEIVVYLESGKILFYSVDDIDGSVLEQIILHPGQKGVYDKKTGLITKHQFIGNNHMAWKTGVLEFVKAPLPDVVKVLEKTYGIKIKSEIPLVDYQLTARFNNETPETVFQSLQIVYGLDYEIDGDLVLIY